MARCIWIAIILVVSVQQVISRDCSNVQSILNCDECIRCGAHWCNKPAMDAPRCSSELRDSWCPNDREALKIIKQKTVPGKNNIDPVFIETNVIVGLPSRIPVTYNSSAEQKVNIMITNTSQTLDISLERSTNCSSGQCILTIEATPGKEFCSSNGRSLEYIEINSKVEAVEEDINIKYNVPCACECTENTEYKSSLCNFRGNYTCGICSCESKWYGLSCEHKICERSRGDMPCINTYKDNVPCSGNGVCDECGMCECNTWGTGWQYFDDQDFCSDLCLTIDAGYSTCFDEITPGTACENRLYFQQYNATLLQDKDNYNRSVWVHCNGKRDETCHVEYEAMVENDNIYVMVASLCGLSLVPIPHTTDGVLIPVHVGTEDKQAFGPEAPIAANAGIGKITVPVILGVISIVVATATVGYLFWKSRVPKLPLNDLQYTNIDAEDCTGENPLYKPPTSSYKNPMYGKS